MEIPDIIKWGAAACVVLAVGSILGWLILNSLNKSRGDGA